MAISAGTVAAVLTLDASQFSGALKTAQSTIGYFSKESASLSGKIKVLGGAMESIGKIATVGITMPLAALGATSVKTFASFEDAILQVKATMNATEDDYQAMSEAAKEMGATTRYDAKDAAAALNYLALAGYNAQDSISLLPQILSLAQAGGLDLGRASDMVTDSMAALGLTMADTTSFTDMMARTAQKSNTSVGQLGEAILTVGGTAKILKGGVLELDTALGIMANSGIKGAEGGTHLRNIILSLTAPTSEAARAMQQMGVSVFNAQGDMRGLDEIFTDLKNAMDAAAFTAEQRQELFSDIFHKTDLASAEALIAGMNGDYAALASEVSNAEGACALMAETMESGLAGSFRSLKSATEGVRISIGEILAPTVQTATDYITGLARGFTELDPAMQKTIVTFGGVAAAAGPMLVIGGKLLKLMTGPVGIISTILGVAAAAAVYISSMDDMGSATDRAWDKLGKSFQGERTDTFSAVINASLDTSSAESTMTDQVKAMYGTVIGTLTDGLPDDPETIDGIKRGVSSKFSTLSEAVDEQLAYELSLLDPDAEGYQSKYTQLVTEAGETKAQLAAYEQEYLTFIDTYAGQSAATVQAHIGELQTLDEKVLKITEDLQAYQDLQASTGKHSFDVVRAGAATDDQTTAEAWQYAYQNYLLKKQAAEDQYTAEMAKLNDEFSRRQYTNNPMSTETYDSYAEGLAGLRDENIGGAQMDYESQARQLFSGMAEAYARVYPEAVREVQDVLDNQALNEEIGKIFGDKTLTDIGNEGMDTSQFSDEMVEYLKKFYGEGYEGAMESLEAGGFAGVGIASELALRLGQGLRTEISELDENPFMEALSGVFQSGALGDLDWDMSGITDYLYDVMQGSGENGAQGLTDGLTAKGAAVSDTAGGIAEDTVDAVKTAWDEHSPSKVFHSVGLFAMLGWAQGISAGQNLVVAAIKRAALAAVAAARETLDINSPSGVFRDIGAFTVQGFKMGIDDNALLAAGAMGNVVASGAELAREKAAPMGGRGGASITFSNTTIRSDSDIRKLARRLGQYLTDNQYT